MSAKKQSAAKRPAGKPFAKGADPRRNTTKPPPVTVSPGRTPDEFKAKMRGLASRDDVLQQLEEILGDKSHPHFIRAWQEAADRGYGKAQQHVDLTTAGQPITVVSGVPEAGA